MINTRAVGTESSEGRFFVVGRRVGVVICKGFYIRYENENGFVKFFLQVHNFFKSLSSLPTKKTMVFNISWNY